MQEAALEDPQYGYVDNEGDFESAVALANGASNLYFFNNRVHNNHNHNLDHGHGGGSLVSSITHLHNPDNHNNHSPNNHNLDNGNGGGSLMSSITHLHDLRLA